MQVVCLFYNLFDNLIGSVRILATILKDGFARLPEMPEIVVLLRRILLKRSQPRWAAISANDPFHSHLECVAVREKDWIDEFITLRWGAIANVNQCIAGGHVPAP